MKKLITLFSFIIILLFLAGCPYTVRYYRFTDEDTELGPVSSDEIYKSDKFKIWFKPPGEWSSSDLFIDNLKCSDLLIRQVSINYVNENGIIIPKELRYQNNGTGIIKTVNGTPDYSGNGLSLEKEKFFLSETYLNHKDFRQNNHLIVNIDIELKVDGEPFSVSKEVYLNKEYYLGWYIGLD